VRKYPGLVGHPQIQRYIQKELNTNTIGFLSSAIGSPIYVAMTNSLSRLEVIMQTSAINDTRISLREAAHEVLQDGRQFGLTVYFAARPSCP